MEAPFKHELPDDGRIPVSRLMPPLRHSSPKPLFKLPQDQNSIAQAAADSVQLNTWWGQMYVHARSRDEAGITGPVFDRVDDNYNWARDEDLTGLWPYLDEFKDVYSHKEFLAQKYKIIINQDLRHEVADYPITNFLSAGLIDPINLIPVPLALGKGFWKGARTAAMINAPLVAGSEALRVDLDPTADRMEILYSTMGSMLFTGVIGGLAGSYKGPIGKMTVSDAMDILVPLDKPIQAEAGMFNWIRYVGKGAFRRIHDSIRSTDNMGGNKSDAHMDRVEVKAEDDGSVMFYLDGENVGFAMNRGGDTLQVSSIEIPEAIRGQGVGTAIYKTLIKYAEDNGLKVVSDTQVSESAAGVWNKLAKEGYNIQKREDAELEEVFDAEMAWTSHRPVFEVLPQLADQAKKIPESLKQDWDEYTAGLKAAEAKVKKITERIASLRKQLDGMENNNGGRRTKQEKRIKEAETDLKYANGEVRINGGKLADTNTKMALMLDEDVAKNWDLLPTGYNKILANTDQFPFWQLMKSPISESMPEVGRRMQLYALRMASTPGLNTEAHKLGFGAGRSVESSAPVHFYGFVNAKKMANKLYAKYLGLGEDTGGFSHYTIDQGQRTRGVLNKARQKVGIDEKPIAGEGRTDKMSIEQWDNEITLAILQKGEHREPLVAEAAKHYMKWLDELGEAARKEGLFSTQKTLARELQRLDAESEKIMKTFPHIIDENGRVELTQGHNSSFLDDLWLEMDHIEAKMDAYMKADSAEIGKQGWIHRIWRKDDVIEKEQELKTYLYKAFTDDPFEGKVTIRIDDQVIEMKLSDEDAILARVDEAYASILKEAEHGGDGEFVVTSTDKRDWLLKRRDVLKAKLDDKSFDPIAEVKALGVEDAEAFVELTKRVGQAEKDGELVVKDPVTGKDFKALELMDQLEAEGKPRMGREFSERRGYSKDEMKDFDEWQNTIEKYMTPENEDDFMFLDGVIKGELEVPSKVPEGQTIGKDRINAALRLEAIERKLERIEANQSTTGGPSVTIGRKLDLDDAVLHEMGVIERSVTAWGQHYVMRLAPLIETSRIFGDGRATKEIGSIYGEIVAKATDARLAGDTKLADKLDLEAERTLTAMNDLRDIVQGVYGIPDNPEAMTGRVLRLLRNLNLISAMGRSTLMAFGDTGNVIMSQGYTNTFRQLINHWRSSASDGSIRMMEHEVELAGSAIEVVMAQRFHQLTELGGSLPRTGSRFNKFERFAANASQRFFLHNLMSPWTDMMRKVSGSMLQSKIIENAHGFRDGTIKAEDIKVMARLGINKDNALAMLKEWELSGSLKHDNMFIANTEQWASEELQMLFRSALNTEINRMVPTPGAADKPKGLLKSEWWKVIGQYRGFSIGATHRIMSAGLQTQSANKWSGMASMITIAMMVDSFKRPDYINLTIEEQVLRAVELSGVTGVILDLNDTIERASAGAIGLRPTLGMDIRERDPNWANRLGTAGAVPNQLLTTLYAISSDDAGTADRTRALRYMLPYNNLIWWNEYVNRLQRSTTDFFED